MTKNEFNNLRIGDTVVVTNHGRNKGKMGTVRDIVRHDINEGAIYIEPIDCEFGFANSYRKPNKEGCWSWSRQSIGLPKKNSKDKIFYIVEAHGGDGVSWSTKNFTEAELKVIERFLEEVEEKPDGMCMEEIVVMDDEV